jgi:hypothetical protein
MSARRPDRLIDQPHRSTFDYRTMTQPVMLHPQEHKDLRIVTRRSAALGDNVQFCLTFPLEFRAVQADYPIVFRHAGEGEDGGDSGWEALALFGLEEGENLFLGPDGEGWHASYIPLAIMRQPFLLGVAGAAPNIHIDLDHPRVSRTEGEVLFLRFGGTSEYMEKVDGTLSAIHDCLQDAPAFFDAVTALGLLVPFNAEFALRDGTTRRLEGFHAVDEDKLAALPADALERLNRAGHLTTLYMAVASLSNLRDLVARKERRDAGQA